MKDLIIIGAGPVGLYSGILASLHNLDFLIIESKNQPGGQLTSLYPEKDIIDLAGLPSISAKNYIDQLMLQLANLSSDSLRLNENVLTIETKEDYHIVHTSTSAYETKAILICTGMGLFMPRKIGLNNEGCFNNILYSLPSKQMLKDKNVIILGGGDSAVDWALTLKDLVKECSIVHRRQEFRAQDNQVQTMRNSTINIYTPYIVKELRGKDNFLTSIVLENVDTKNEQELSCDYLFVNYGLIPTKDNFNVAKENGLITVNRTFETSIKNIFAVGNIITYEGKVKNITCGLGEAVVAITKIDQILNPTKNIPIHF